MYQIQVDTLPLSPNGPGKRRSLLTMREDLGKTSYQIVKGHETALFHIWDLVPVYVIEHGYFYNKLQESTCLSKVLPTILKGEIPIQPELEQQILPFRNIMLQLKQQKTPDVRDVEQANKLLATVSTKNPKLYQEMSNLLQFHPKQSIEHTL